LTTLSYNLRWHLLNGFSFSHFFIFQNHSEDVTSGYERKLSKISSQNIIVQLFPNSFKKLTGVPLTTVDTYLGAVPSSSKSGTSRESPKSATLAVNLESRRMLLALISLWNIGGLASVWRYSMPLAAPIAILNLVLKFRLPFVFLLLPASPQYPLTYNMSLLHHWEHQQSHIKLLH